VGRRRLRWVAAGAAIGSVAILAAALVWFNRPSDTASPRTIVPTVRVDPADISLIVAGDIACAPERPTDATTCHQEATADLLDRSSLARHASGAVLLGDIQYESGRITDFGSFQGSWGAALAAARVPVFPTPGNHEWYDDDPPPAGCRLVDADHNACGYETFFGGDAFAGDVSDGLGNRGIRFDTQGARHPLVLLLVDAGRCEHDPSACGPASPAASFLRSSLADPSFNPPGACVVVGWHQARWSDYGHGNLAMVDGLWRALFSPPDAQRPDLVVNGHDHLYERMPALDVEGQPNATGIAEVIAGAGGREIAGVPYVGAALGRAEFIDVQHFGVVALSEDPAAGTVTTTFLTEDGPAVDRTSVDCRV
jgi:hypothetical protein